MKSGPFYENVCISVLMILWLPGALVAQEWEHYSDTEMDTANEIEIFYRYIKVSGIDYLEFKGTTIINSPLTPLVAVIRDVAEMPKWVYNVESAELLIINEKERYTYFVHKSIGFFFKSRDSYVYSILSQDSGTLDVTVKGYSKPDKMKRTQQYVRIETGESHWLFSPISTSQSRVVFQGYANPGGWISASLLTPLAKSELWKLPYYSLKELQVQILEKKYQQVRFPFIENY